MLRLMSLSVLAIGLAAPVAHAAEVAAAPAAQIGNQVANVETSRADVEAPAKVRTACDSYGRCFDFAGPNDQLASDSTSLLRVDPMALAQGTPGEPLEDLADD